MRIRNPHTIALHASSSCVHWSLVISFIFLYIFNVIHGTHTETHKKGKRKMATSQVKLKLLIDTQGQRVLFAEAGKDVVDFLFYLLSLPLATVTRILKAKGDNVGCLTDLYQILDSLNMTYMLPNKDMSSLLNPRSPLHANGIPLLLSDHDCNHHFMTTRKVYRCKSGCQRLADVPNYSCPNCGNLMTHGGSFVNTPAAATTVDTSTVEGGFVKGVVTYMVMDNLEVKPMSTISSITLLNQFNVKNVGSLEEKVVVLGVDEGLKLLKASLECKTVLTSIFLGKSVA
ncbi:hypothetical protein ACOSQ3_033192 [Xanthoceras sorbifolium]